MKYNTEYKQRQRVVAKIEDVTAEQLLQVLRELHVKLF